jgi:hypothetical protein
MEEVLTATIRWDISTADVAIKYETSFCNGDKTWIQRVCTWLRF